MQQNKIISIYLKKTLVAFLFLSAISLSQAAAPNWNVKPSDYVNSMTLIGQVDKIYAAKANDIIAAFSNGVCRGMTKPTFVPELNAYYFYLVVFANDKDPKNLTFQYYQSEKDSVVQLFSILKFENNNSLGSLTAPYIFYSDRAEILSFGFAGMPSEFQIDSSLKKITVAVPIKANLSNLKASFILTPQAKASINSQIQQSDTTVNDFTTAQVYTITSANGKINTYTVTVFQSATLGIEDDFNASTFFRVFPNPAQQVLYVSFNGLTTFHASLQLYDGSGRKINEPTAIGPGQNSIDVSALTSGKYYYSIVDKGHFLKQAGFLKE